jgi:hypothetical protein
MLDGWDEHIDSFLIACSKWEVNMMMIGGGAVNFHGYQRHSADVDFWFEASSENFSKLISALNEIGFTITEFPTKVLNQEQNISIKFSPVTIQIELITNFSVNRPFGEALADAYEVQIGSNKLYRYHVIGYNDLITSKIKAARPKDLLDIQELERINK